jgi:predicted phage terminase large subunit-like protein
MSNIIFSPVSKEQEAFLNSTSFFTLYGGSAGSGKSAAILGSILPICHHRGTRALIIRKTTKQLSGSGSLFDAAIQLFSRVDPKIKIKTRDLTIIFSSGAQVQFTYLDKPSDRLNLQGKEYSLIAFDECQQLSEDNVLYALSRLRSTLVDYPLRAIASCNPDYDSFLRSYVEFCLDERGIPKIREDGKYPERYFYRTPTGVIWYNTLEEAQAAHGSGQNSGIKSFKFIPATAYTNTVLLKTNPEYISTLKALPRVEMERLLLGSWYARETASGYFKREWVTMVDYPDISTTKRCRAWDLAFTKPSEAYPDVDATAGVLVSKNKSAYLTVENVVTMRDRVHEVERLVFETAYNDGRETTILLPLDPGATGGAYCRDLARRLGEKGYYVKLIRPEKSKRLRFLPFASMAEARAVHVVRADWNDSFFSELETMDFTNKTHDDMADACSDATYYLNRSIELPNFQIPTVPSGLNFDFSYKI